MRRAKKIKSNVPSTVGERKGAEYVIIRDLQCQTYEKEIEQLKKGNQLTKNNKLYQLDVFIDTDGIVKVGGRPPFVPLRVTETSHIHSKGASCHEADNSSQPRKDKASRKGLYC